MTQQAWNRMNRRANAKEGTKDFDPLYAHVENKFDSPLDLAADIGLHPGGKGCSLDRIDPFGHYEPGNVRWADVMTQARNKRNTVKLTINGVTKPMTEWAEHPDAVPYKAMNNRLRKNKGWSHEEIAFKPVRVRKPTNYRHPTNKSTWPEYRAVYRARARCNNPNNPDYDNYGARNIECFLINGDCVINSIGFRPSPNHSLDRIDNDGHYEIGNIRWATTETQRANKRKARRKKWKYD